MEVSFKNTRKCQPIELLEESVFPHLCKQLTDTIILKIFFRFCKGEFWVDWERERERERERWLACAVARGRLNWLTWSYQVKMRTFLWLMHFKGSIKKSLHNLFGNWNA